MRFRQHQWQAHTQTTRLFAWFAVLLLTLTLSINLLLALGYKLLMPWGHGFPALFFETNTGLILLFVLGGSLVETQRLREGGGSRVAHWLGGREVTDPDDALERRLLNVVDEMAIASGQAIPRVFVMRQEDAINAFVAGWGPQDMALSVTRGALERLTRAELQGLVAHEFGHIKEDDLPLSMRMLALVWGLSLIHGYGQHLMAADEHGHVSPLSWVAGLAFSVAGWLGWLAGRALQAAVSRQREFLADASAVQFTRTRDGLGHVLRKVWYDQQVLAGRMHHPAAGMVASLLMHRPGGTSCLDTHPKLSERIRRICGSVLPPQPAPLLRLDAVEPRRRQTHMPGQALGAMPLNKTGDMTRPQQDPILLASQQQQARIHADREALARLHGLNGPTERRLIVLGLMMNTSNARECKLWHHHAEGLSHAERLIEDITQLLPNRRVPEFERLSKAISSEPIEQRRLLVEQARDLLKADGRVSARERLWWLALRHQMGVGAKKLAFMRPTTGNEQALNALQANELAHVQTLTAYLARFIPVEDDDGSSISTASKAWYQGVMRRCTSSTNWHTPNDTPDADALMHALSNVQELSWLLRPQLLKAWVEEAINHSPQGLLSDNTADALRLAAGLLDAPLPPMLAAHYAR
jgi:Zn-dependent protease with chaperone function